MKKKSLSSLKLRKNKISNLTKLSNLIGGTDSIPPPTDENPSTLVTDLTYCNSCYECISENPTDCQTNDRTRSLGNPTGMNTTIDGMFSEADC
ncbi:MAG: hypothetical protein AB8B65_07415 [Kordia sp.]|uniref:hypothetical protein n=1 Tax=Kordia sp. TaxID=1965332 RepID=UPI00385EB663